MAPSAARTWIPVDVKILWFSFLGAADAARCSRVCRSWVSLVQKSVDASIVDLIGASTPQLGRASKLKFYHRLLHATAPENMGYLLSWAAGSREYTPFLHKLLLLRDTIREDFGLPGGLHETARPDAYADCDEEVRALFTYRLGAVGSSSGVDLVHQPPLIVAVSRGNVDAVHLLLLFGEGVHCRRKGNERALYIAAEQGSAAVVAALLGRVPLRPPRHHPSSASRLGLLRPVWSVYPVPAGGGGAVYVSGVAVGPRQVPAAIASTRMRAELAAATGFLTAAGQVKASASSAATERMGSFSTGGPCMSPVEAAVSQLALFEADGRYRAWCNGYRMGTFWHTYDTALAAWEGAHGAVGETSATVSAGSGTGTAAGSRAGRAAKAGTPRSPSALITTTLFNLRARLDACAAPGTTVHGSLEGVTPAYAAQALVTSRAPLNLAICVASRPQRARTHLHPRIPPPIDYGALASDAIAVKVRVNVGPGEGRTPLWAACELGRLEIAYLLLSHHDPHMALRAEVPELAVKRVEEGGGEGGPAAPGGPTAPPPLPAPLPAPGALGGAAAEANPPASASAQHAARAALACIAGMSVPALVLPVDILVSTHPSPSASLGREGGYAASQASTHGPGAERRDEVLREAMGEEGGRDMCDVEASPPGHHSPLGLACERGDPLLVQLLLHWGADVNRPGRKDAPPVLTAAMAHHEAVLSVLLRAACSGVPGGPAQEVAAVIDCIRAKRGLLPLTMGERGRVRPVNGQDSDAEGEGEWDTPRTLHLFARPGITGSLFASLGLTSAHASLRALAAGGRSTPLLRSVLCSSGCAPLRRTLSEGYSPSNGADQAGKGGTAATNAMGSTVGAQRRGGAKAAREREGRQEEAPLDLCEPTIVSALAAAAAAASASAVDEYGGPMPARPTPIDMTLHLPADEAAVASGDGAGGGPSALAYYRTGAIGMKSGTKVGGGAGGGRLVALMAAHNKASPVTVLGPTLASMSSAGSVAVDSTPFPEDVGIEPEEVLVHSTTPSYLALVASCERYKRSLRAAVLDLAARSRACGGVGAMDGRPALDVNIGDESGYTPLFIMASAGRLEAVMLLIAAGADPTLLTKRGKTPIYGAVEKGHEGVTEFLMTRYTSTQLRANTTYGTNVLHAASKAGNSKIRDSLTMYCVEHDARMAKVQKLETVARRKAMWGEGGADGGEGSDADGGALGAVGGLAAENLRKLRIAAESSKRKSDEAGARLARGRRGAGTAASPYSDSEAASEGEGEGARGRSRKRRGSDSGTATEGEAASPYAAKPVSKGAAGGVGRASSTVGRPPKAQAAPAPPTAGSSAAATAAVYSVAPKAVVRAVSTAKGQADGLGVKPTPVALSHAAASPSVSRARRASIISTAGSGDEDGPAARVRTLVLPMGPARSPGESVSTVASHAAGGGSAASSPLSTQPSAREGVASPSQGGGPLTSPVSAQAAAMGSSVFQRLAARAKELELKRKAQEEELHTHGTGGGVKEGNSAADSSLGTKKVGKDAVVPPKPGTKPAYLLAFEREKAEKAAAAVALALAQSAKGGRAGTAGSDASGISTSSLDLGPVLPRALKAVLPSVVPVAGLASVHDKEEERGRRAAYFDKLLASSAVHVPTSAPVSVPAVVEAAGASFDAAAAAFASKKAELDDMLAGLDARERGKEALTKSTLSPGRLTSEPPPASSLDRSAAVKAKAAVLGLGLGLRDAGSSSPSSPYHGLLTRGLSLGLGAPGGSTSRAQGLANGSLGSGSGVSAVRAAAVAAASAIASAESEADRPVPASHSATAAEMAAREERNRAREAARVARLAAAKEEAEARRREEEAQPQATGAGAASSLSSLRMAVAAYGSGIVPKKRK